MPSGADVGLQLEDGKRFLFRLQELIVSEQLRRHCEENDPVPFAVVEET